MSSLLTPYLPFVRSMTTHGIISTWSVSSYKTSGSLLCPLSPRLSDIGHLPYISNDSGYGEETIGFSYGQLVNAVGVERSSIDNAQSLVGTISSIYKSGENDKYGNNTSQVGLHYLTSHKPGLSQSQGPRGAVDLSWLKIYVYV
ncbi:hypothetical protein TREMEDRAFT_61250 [Tremella mesenterica DSM 1558]|uniref:uncharacterized protein n=1 Tax=Tremella mesenterica (strain ATCC 24925 / CBS 8224 / DSM 1558 / NBRC 9311 / NRRL Y-6157 / RJB 2259-6 / UBC 559-6) TaxID=578456 RepID=UPI0003F49407|nr:uncharacterized protein TREMEDRAFT_61250 [Tremella mesenterica DSM 1558]EIW70740.1 hypothetical protein TREMEDRAFT_61250 [Tremella mesenterica DSM 1558]